VSYDLWLWKRKAGSATSRGLTFLMLAEGLPCAGVARFPEAAIEESLRQEFGAQDDFPFELSISKDGMFVGLPFSQANELSARFRAIASRERLEIYDPQVDVPTDEDAAAFEAQRNPPGADSPKDEFADWLKAAEAGDRPSMNKVGGCYRYGSGVERNLTKAVEWFRRAAEKGNLPATINLAECYLNGEGVSKDANEAARLFKEAFKAEQCVSAFELGKLHEAGLGVEKSLERAVEYFRTARANNHPEAYRALKRLGAA